MRTDIPAHFRARQEVEMYGARLLIPALEHLLAL